MLASFNGKVTKVGCGNAGFDVEFMAQFFKRALDMKNVRLPREFVEILEPDNVDDFVNINNSDLIVNRYEKIFIYSPGNAADGSMSAGALPHGLPGRSA